MDPVGSRYGQGARLVVGRSRRGIASYDTSAFSELQRPAVDPGPYVPGGDLPVRTLTDVTKGLGLPYESERDLIRSVGEWLQAPNPVAFRGRVLKGLRSFAPDNYVVRNELWRRATELYRSTKPMVDRRPGSVVIQKSEGAPKPVGKAHLKHLIAVYVARGGRLKGGKADKRDPRDFDPGEVALGVAVEREHTTNKLEALEIACDHLVEDKAYYTHLVEMEAKYSKALIRQPPTRRSKEKLEEGAQRPESMKLKPQPKPENPRPEPPKAEKPLMFKSDDWEPMPGISGGIRRMVPGGYEYRFEDAEFAPAPDPALERLFATRATPQPPELLFCFDGDENMEKGAQHKYLKRTPTGKQRPKWRYVYKLPTRRGLVVDEHLVEGTKFKVTHEGKTGHFEVMAHDQAKGIVTVRHDESGRTAHIRHKDLGRMLEAQHRRQGQEAAAKTPEAEKAPADKLPRVQMADLARGEWEEVVGFEPTEEAALQLAGGLKKGWDYAAIKQPNGYMVVAKLQAGAAKPRREIHGSPVKVHLRNEKPMDAVYTLMEADDVVASHNPVNFNIRKDYPEGVQEREYHRSQNEQGKVIGIAQELEPVFLINNNPDGVNGTPIVTDDGVVLGGNARTMGIQRAYKAVPESAKKYKNYLVAHARDYGFKAADVRNMQHPVLVRRSKVSKTNKRFQSDGEFDQTKYNAHLRLLGRRMNEGMTQGLDPRAEEVALGKNFVNDRMLRAMTDSIEEGQTLDAYLRSEKSRTFVKTLWANGILDKMNAGQFTYGKDAGADEGLLNEEGRNRLERILVGKMIDSPSLLDRMSPTQRRAIAGSAVHVVVAQQNGWDVVPKLKRAIQIDQSIQRMEKELDAVGNPRKALKNFLSGKQVEMPGVSSMVEEVRNDPMLQNLLIIVRDKMGTDKTPRDFRGFALRAMEDAKKNEELTGQGDMFGGTYAAKREDPVEALDIEFGVTPPRAAEKIERQRAEREAKKREEEERKRRAAELKQMQASQSGLFAASMDYDMDLVKAEGEPNRLVTRAINHAGLLVDAAVSTSMLEHGEIRVDGAKIAKRVLSDIAEVIRKDPAMAREQGRSPIDAKTIRGLVEALVQIRGKDLIEKGRGATDLVKGGSQRRPPGSGWLPPSGKRKVTWMKIVGGKKVYWSPSKGHHAEPAQTLFGDEEQPLPKPTRADLQEAYKQVAESDEYRRANEIADRLKRHGLDNLPGKYAQAVEHWEKHKDYQLALVRQVSDIEVVHRRQDEAREFAQQQGDLMREFETRQRTMFVEQPPEPERRGLEPAEIKAKAHEAYSLGAKDPSAFTRYMNNVVDKHGEAQAKLVMQHVQVLQESRHRQDAAEERQARRERKRKSEIAMRRRQEPGKGDASGWAELDRTDREEGIARPEYQATAEAERARRSSSGSQLGMFSGHQATQRGEQGELFRSMITRDDLLEYGRRRDIEDPGWREHQRAQMTRDWLEDGIPLEKINAWFDRPARRLVVKSRVYR